MIFGSFEEFYWKFLLVQMIYFFEPTHAVIFTQSNDIEVFSISIKGHHPFLI